MPTLDKIRLNHISYNNGNSLIRDLTFDAAGATTLLNLENGGGKTVINQLCHAPYLSSKDRNFGKRRFEELFVTPTPSWVLHEWNMDEEAGRFVVGLLICRRRDQKAEQENELGRLSILAFIDEYPGESGSHVHLYQLGQENRFYKYSEARNYLDMLAADKNRNLRIYNLANSAHRQAYQDRLRDLGISLSEWKQMRDFNQEESGIGKFAEIYPTEEKLVNDVLLPAAEEKLNAFSASRGSSQGILELIQDNVENYARNLLANRQDLESYEVYSSFLKSLDFIEESEEQVRNALDRVHEAEDRIRSRCAALHHRIVSSEEKIASDENSLEAAQKQKVFLRAQQISLDWHQRQEKLEQQQADLDRTQKQLKEKEAAYQNASRQNALLSCAKTAAGLHDLDLEISSMEAEMEKASASSAQSAEKLRYFGKGYYEAVLEENTALSAQLADLETRQSALEKSRADSTKEIRQLQQQIRQQEGNSSRLEAKLESYTQNKEQLETALQTSFPENMEPYTNKALFTRCRNLLDGKRNDSRARQNSLEKRIRRLRQSLEENSTQVSALAQSSGSLQEKLAQLQKQTRRNEKNLQTRQSIVSRLFAAGEQEQKLWQDEEISAKLKEQLVQARNAQKDLVADISLLEADIANLHTGTSAKIDEEVLQSCRRLGIEPEYATGWLKETQLETGELERMLDLFPLLPFCLLMSQEQKEQLLADLQSKHVHTSQLLPVLSLEELKQLQSGKVPVPGVNDCIYACFNQDLLNPEELRRKVDALQKQKQQLREQSRLYEQEIELNTQDQVWLEHTAVSRSEYDSCQNEITKTRKKLTDLEQEINTLKSRGQQLDDQKKTAEEKLLTAQQETGLLEEQIRQLEAFLPRIEKARENWLELRDQQKQLENLQENLDEQEEAREEAYEQLQELAGAIQELLLELKTRQSLTDELAQFADAEDYAQGDRDWLKEQYEVWKNDSSRSQLRMLETRVASLKKRRRGQEEDLQEQLDQDGLTRADLEGVIYSAQESRKYRDICRELNEDIRSLQKRQTDLLVAIGQSNTRLQTLLEKLTEQTGLEEPVAKDQIQILDWTREAARLNEEIRSLEQTIRRLQQENSQCQAQSDALEQTLTGIHFQNRPVVPEDIDSLTIQALMSTSRELPNLLRAAQSDLRQKVDTVRSNIALVREKTDPEFDRLLEILTSLSQSCQDPDLFYPNFTRQKQIIESFLSSMEQTRAHNQQLKQTCIQNIVDHIFQLHEQISRMDSAMSIESHGRRLKMLEIQLPSLEQAQDLYLPSVEAYVDAAAEQLIASDMNAAVLWKQITPQKLFALLIQPETIRIRVRKFEEFRQDTVPWRQVAKLSGAESFLSSMIVMLAVLYYQRNDAIGHLSRRQHPTVIFMDNPFAYVQSEHILEPLLQLLKRTNTQMIALSKVENAAIINAFDNIYFLHLKLFADQKQHLLADHMKSPAQMDSIHLQILPDEEEFDEEGEEFVEEEL